MRNKSGDNESGSSVIEFVSFVALFFFPIVFFFAAVTANSLLRIREEELFREIIRILSSSNDFEQSVNTARRYLTLHNSSASLEVFCVSGTCPRRGSSFRVSLMGRQSKLETVLQGGNWR